MYLVIAALLSLCICATTGCVPLGPLSQIPDGAVVREIGKADPMAPLAVNANGDLASVWEKRLEFLAPEGKLGRVAEGNATVLSFTPGGDKIAAAVPVLTGGTSLRLFSRDGKLLAQTTVPERVTSLAWRSDKELLAAALKINKVTIGSELVSLLYTWDGVDAPVATQLSSVTVRPQVAKLPEETLYKSFNMAISPYGDEIVYTTLKDPPLLSPYLRIATRHLDSGAEHVIGKSSVGSGSPIYFPDGESLLAADKESLSRRLTLPDGKEVDAWPAPGTYPAMSPSGSFIFLDGRLYENGRSAGLFPTDTRAVFLPDGTGLAISYNGKLYRITGINDGMKPAPPQDLKRLLQLRRLRSLGLITEKEYRKEKGKAAAGDR
jgi:hypothetical protein